MKNTFLFSLILLLSSFSTLRAQSAAEAELLKGWDEIWKAYSSNDMTKVWAFYAENATEIYPDGSMAAGVATIKAGYEQFSAMLEGTPSWKMDKPVVRFITPDVALLTSNIVTDMKLKGGQQIGGKGTFAVIVHKVKGKWLIEFDSQTPVINMAENNK